MLAGDRAAVVWEKGADEGQGCGHGAAKRTIKDCRVPSYSRVLTATAWTSRLSLHPLVASQGLFCCAVHSNHSATLALAMTVNASFVSPTADAKVAHMITQFDTAGLLSTLVNGFTFWKAALALLVGAVLYDQCE